MDRSSSRKEEKGFNEMARKARFGKEESLLDERKRNMKIVCPYCGRRVHFYAFEKSDRQLCDWCGRYVFKDKQTEFKYRVTELKNRKERNENKNI